MTDDRFLQEYKGTWIVMKDTREFRRVTYIGGPAAGVQEELHDRGEKTDAVIDIPGEGVYAHVGDNVYTWHPHVEPDSCDFFIDPIIGWRAWGLVRNSSEQLQLTSPVAVPLSVAELNSTIWPTYEKMSARCLKVADPTRHIAPRYDCTCGLYAVRTADKVFTTVASVVIGEVKLWGKVIEHEDGYRAQYAYPARLILDMMSRMMAGELSDAYGVPVAIANSSTVLSPPQSRVWDPNANKSRGGG